MGTLIARVTDSSNLVREVNFYRRLPTQAAPGSGPYPADIVRRPTPGAGVYEYDFVLDTELDTMGMIELVLEDGRTIRSAEQLFVRRNVDAGASLPLTGGTLTGLLTTPGLVSTASISSRIAYSDSSGGASLSMANTSGARRFVFGLIGAESGSNNGGNLALWGYGDTGSGLGSPMTVTRSNGVVNFGTTPTVAGSAVALASHLSGYLPLAGGTMNNQLVVKRDVGTTPAYGDGQLVLNSNGANPVVLGLLRQGHTALALRHASASLLELVNDLGGYATYAGAAFETRGGNTSWGNARLYNGNEWGGGTLAYPTVGSGAGGGIMLRRPHVPHFGDGSYVRMATDTAVSSYWDMGAMGDEFKVRRSASSASFLIDRQGAACIDRTDSWTGDIESTRNHLHLRAASDVARRLTLTYSATGGPGNNGYGVIAAGRVGVGWTLLALQPAGGAVCVGPVPVADYALNVNGPVFTTAGLVSGSTEWLASRAHRSSIHGVESHVLTRSQEGISMQYQNGTPAGYVAFDGSGFGLKHGGGGWSVLTTAGGVKLHGQVVDEAGNTFATSLSGTGSPSMAAREGAIYIQY
ncbi:MAG TPA: hypothetical protein VF613_05775 [Longimicrobium sp.]|jgi:hypothetical protein